MQCFWEEFRESAQNSLYKHLNELITISEKFIQATNLMCALGVGLVYNWRPSYLNITPLGHPVDRLLLEKEQKIKQRENVFYSSNIIGGDFVV